MIYLNFHIQLTSTHLLTPIPILPQIQHIHNNQIKLKLNQKFHKTNQ